MSSYTLSPEAQKSLLQIKTYSIKHFDVNNTNNTYLQNIRDRLQVLANNPSLGILRKDLNSKCHSNFIASHTVYYLIKDNQIQVIDILHQSMEPSLHITESL